MSQSGLLSGSSGGGVPIETISGDIGAITGTNVTIFAHNSVLNCGSTVLFSNSGDTSTFNVTDGARNTVIGSSSGVLGNIASDCTSLGANTLQNITDDIQHVAIGSGALQSVNDGEQNTACGAFSLNAVVSGGLNTAIGCQSGVNLANGNFNNLFGFQSGFSYTGSENSNILIQNVGVTGESNVMRIGTTGAAPLQVNTTFVSGILGTVIPASGNRVVTINDPTEQVAFVPDGLANQILTTNGTGTINWRGLSTNIQAFLLAGTFTYTPTPGMIFVFVRVVGGGGGGGGVADLSGSVNFVSGGTGGGGGGYAESFFSAFTIGVSQSVTVGTGGAGGIGGVNGANGGSSAFGLFISASGGMGGTLTPPSDSVSNNPSGGLGGGSIGGTVDIAGGRGSASFSYTITTASIATPIALFSSGGEGGATPLGAGGGRVSASSPGQTGVDGNDGNGPGGGGSGAAEVYNPAGIARNGGNGADGAVIITEFILS